MALRPLSSCISPGRPWVLALLLLAGTGSAVPRPCAAEDPPPAIVPDLSMLALPEAAQALADGGLVLERYYEHRYSQGYELGRVIQQKPRPGALVKRGSGVLLMVSAAENGAPAGKAADPSWPRPAFDAPSPAATAVPPPAPPASPPLLPTPRPPGARGGSEAVPPPLPVPPSLPVPPPLPEAPLVPPAGELPSSPSPPTSLPAAPLVLPDASGSGSPDAPLVAERATPGVVPDLRGLSLNDAEQRAREAGLEVYVERVPGHPVGRVLEQIPAPGSERAKGSIVRVNVTAGGDFDGGVVVPSPAVDVPRVMVPDLLDRTPPQAERILTDLGLALRFEEAKSGLPGRVVDQKPASGQEVPKGSLVTLWVALGGTRPASAAPVGPPAPAQGAAPSLPVAPPAPPAPPQAFAPSGAGALPVSVAPTQAGVPAPIAPSEGTLLPKQRTLALGFSWLPVEHADAYVLEVEERGPSGWLPSVRKPARAAATTVELERIAPQASDVRWRVRAVLAGREGQPSAWVTLR